MGWTRIGGRAVGVERVRDGEGRREDRKFAGQHQRAALHIDHSPRPPVCFSQSPSLCSHLPNPGGHSQGRGFSVHTPGMWLRPTLLLGLKAFHPPATPDLNKALGCHLPAQQPPPPGGLP